MSERPEADKVEVPAKPATTSTATTSAATPGEPLKTTEKAGTGKVDVKKDEPDEGKKKGKGTWYGRDEYPDGYVMHHEMNGTITLDSPHPNKATGMWNFQDGGWMDLAGNPMPEGWGGGHMPTDYGSGKGSLSTPPQ